MPDSSLTPLTPLPMPPPTGTTFRAKASVMRSVIWIRSLP